ncbi:MAG: hypothetical protein HY840_00565 [Bacteroidetes bacterium]|nr:hypothetical protein [Bacteroidota bacterium]
MKTIALLFTVATVFLAATSCNKNRPDCFDKKLYRQHKNDLCTDDCPGVVGCDGKLYCNECYATRQGIHVK